jgi:Protein of unknown function DUF262
MVDQRALSARRWYAEAAGSIMSSTASRIRLGEPDLTTEETGDPKPAFRDPKPTAERVPQLALRVLSGDILLPRFQRGFVWNRSQIIDLLDSIARNYPIGSMLLWQSKKELANEGYSGCPVEVQADDC